MRQRSELLREHIHGLLDAGVRRPLTWGILAESLAATRGEAQPLRRAKAFAHLLDRTGQVVLPHEMLAGSVLGLWPLAEGLPSYEGRLEEARGVVQDYLATRKAGAWRPREARWALMARDHYEASVTFGELERLTASVAGELAGEARVTYAEVFRELENHFAFRRSPAERELLADLPWFASNHLHLKYEKALRAGLGAMRADVAARMAEAREATKKALQREGEAGGTPAPQGREAGGTPAPQRAEAGGEKGAFYESVLIALDATIRFIGRYARTLEGAAKEAEAMDRLKAALQTGEERLNVALQRGEERAAERAAELRTMAEVCDRIAVAQPQSFREAIQLVWMLHVVAHIGDGSAMSLGRFDQYLGPFYERDIASGRTTREDAQALVECLWLKVNEPKMRTVQSVCLGGLKPDGSDGTNAFTYVCLDACAAVREPYPNTCVRVHPGMPEALWDKIAQTLAAKIGQPMLFNDAAMLAGLARTGIPERDAREYFPMGCVEVMLAGMQPTYQGAGSMVFPDAIEDVLKNGHGSHAGIPGVATGELAEFGTFEKFLAACVAQIEHHVRASIAATEERMKQGWPERTDPFASAFVEGCIESGTDVCHGGAKYPRIFSFGSMGLGTAVDSLSAIQTFVYERNQFTLPELAGMLERNFDGSESVRALLARSTPAFGNDLAEVDDIAERVFGAFTGAILGYRSEIGATYLPQSFSYHSHVWQGEMTPATANGRLRGTTLSDSLGPSQGCDTSGPTCLIHSMTRIDGSKLTGGCAFNLKIGADFVRGEEGRRVLASLLRTYIAQGGMQVQVNILDQQTLRRAQAEPEQYRNVIVRVAGYSEYFTALDRKLQDEIIARTAH